MSHDALQVLEDQVRKLEGELRLSQQRNESSGNNFVVNSTKDRKIEKFISSMDFDEWVLNIELYINKKFSSEQEKVVFIWDHLHEDVKIEIRHQIDCQKSKACEVVALLKNIYGVKKTPFELEVEFYATNQNHGETLTTYSHSLMKILFLLQKQAPHIKANSEQMLKQKFADGVLDHDLKRELKRLNRENNDILFYQLRDLGIDWLKDSRPETSKLDSLMEMITLQQQQIQTLTDSMKDQSNKMSQVEEHNASYNRGRGNNRSRGHFRGRSRGRGWSRSRNFNAKSDIGESNDSGKGNVNSNDDINDQDPIICHYCSQPNHIAPNCFKRLRDYKRGALNKHSSN